MHTTTALIFASALLGTATAAAPVSQEIPRGFLTRSVKVKDIDVRYAVYVPQSYRPGEPIPTIVFLNGAGECGTDGLKQLYHFGNAIMLAADKWPFLIVFPQKQDVRTLWEDEEPVMMAALEAVKRDYAVDGSRLYLTGLSQGGHGTWAIAARHPDMFAAIAPICGWGDKEIAARLVKMPIWCFHGDQDQAVDVERSREMERFVEEAGGSCRLTIYPGVGHNSWDKAYREENLGQWFLQHQRK